MKITIDTSHDSKEEIQHAIDLLSKVVGKRQAVMQEDASIANNEMNALVNLFNDDAPKANSSQSEPQVQSYSQPVPDPEASFNTISKALNAAKEHEEVPEVIPYD